MKLCASCRQQNHDDARFCQQCGIPLDTPIEQFEQSAAPAPAPTSNETEELWRTFIGPNADRYLQQFKKFGPEQAPQFALTWNWPAFLFISFLWFLYRKMYLYAAVYAIGPMISTYLTGDMSSGIVWSIVAGATSNYVYYWHCREQISEIKQRTWSNPTQMDAKIKEAGGVQPYVIYVGIAFYLLFSLTMIKMIEEGSLEGDQLPAKPAATVRT
ncbi:hypothetical protein [Petrachloros mirabilis]